MNCDLYLALRETDRLRVFENRVLGSMSESEEKEISWLYVLLTVHPCIILQISPTRCTILLNIFISLLCMFRASTCPSSGKITVSMRQWCLSLCLSGVWSAAADQTPPKQSEKYHCRIDTVILLMMGTWMPETRREVK